jgi:AraC family transcriptional regulator of adaptative response/methylated-DNA-[protein]-cysteine methyltransferase
MVATAMPRPLPALTDDARYEAVAARDRAYDGAFVVAVVTTGVYCRPTCSARTPYRRNVRFFSHAAAAEAAGFRACKRCRPRDAAPPGVDAVERSCRRIEAAADGGVSLAALAAAERMTPHALQRAFKRALGVTPRQYAAELRLRTLKRELRRGAGVADATYGAGYGSSSRVYERAHERLGMTPGAYRRRGAGMRIRYAIGDSTFGRLLVGATERGVCAVKLGDDDALLEAHLRREYADAEIERDDVTLKSWLDAVARRLAGRGPHRDLPLDVRGTAFQVRVWQELMKIPAGQTRSYSEIARAIGNPKAVRAVGSACGANHAAIIIPCHRAVREDGTLGGYAWGLDRKRRLLDLEQDEASRRSRRKRA